jgi:hypothetical protein
MLKSQAGGTSLRKTSSTICGADITEMRPTSPHIIQYPFMGALGMPQGCLISDPMVSYVFLPNKRMSATGLIPINWNGTYER